MQRYDSAGVALGSETLVNTTTTSDQYVPSVAALSDGGYVVTWVSLNQDGSFGGVYSKLYAAVDSVITVSATTDFTGQTLTDKDGIAFAAAGTATFTASQFGTGLISNAVAITGDANTNAIVINMTSGGAFTAAGWTFTNWTTNTDRITLNGSASDDTITGSSQKDTLNGGGGNDSIIGGGGNDFFNGGAGSDSLVGGAGSDTFQDLNNTADTMEGGDGADLYNVDNIGDVVVELGTDASTDVISVWNGTTYTMSANVENGSVSGGATNLTGNAGANRLSGNFEGDTLSGMAGADYIDGATGNDSLLGGDDNDTVLGSMGADTVIGGAGDDSVMGGDFSGIDGAGDRVEGGTGNDTLFSSDGGDTLVGGADSDLYQIYNADAVITELLDEGMDTVESGVASYTLGDNVENGRFRSGANGTLIGNAIGNTLEGSTGADTLDGMGGNDSLTGGNGADSLTGGMGSDTLDGGTGDDTMIGGADDDTYIVDSLTDTLVEAASAGTDTVQTDLAAFTLAADFENLSGTSGAGQRLRGNDTSNSITGGSGNDTLLGFLGNDTLLGGNGADVMAGGDGEDSLVADSGNDILFGDNSNDTLDGGGGFDYLYGGIGNNSLTGGMGDDILISQGTRDTLDGGADHNWFYRMVDGRSTITGGSGVDEFYDLSTASLDTFSGGDGDDYASGGNGDDSLSGGAGNDVLVGGNGNDRLDGGTGVNYLYASGTLSDTIVVNSASGSQVQIISDFEAGGAFDVVSISGSTLTDFADVEALVANLGIVIGGNLLQNTGVGCILTLNIGQANQTDIWFYGALAGALTAQDFTFG
jgi:Ca2+-binding RTX toxin-like protein